MKLNTTVLNERSFEQKRISYIIIVLNSRTGKTSMFLEKHQNSGCLWNKEFGIVIDLKVA